MHKYNHTDLLTVTRRLYDACLIKQYEIEEVAKMNTIPGSGSPSGLQTQRANISPSLSGKLTNAVALSKLDTAVTNLKNASSAEDKLKAQIQILSLFIADVGLCPPGTIECAEGCCSTDLGGAQLWQ